MTGQRKQNAKRRKGGKPKPVGALIGGLMEPLLRKRGFATADLITHWADLAGPRYARLTQPEKVNWPRGGDFDPEAGHRPGTLVLACDPAAVLFVQHEIDRIRERINAFFGFEVVDRIKIVQKSFDDDREEPAAAAPRKLDGDDVRRLDALTAPVGDPDLRAALDRLGRAVLSESSRKADDGAA